MSDPVKLKERATEAFAKGKFAKAGELYLDYCKAMPRDLQSRLRMGDAWARAHQKDRAIHAYQEAAEGFAKAGFLPRAIAASKLILELDPAHQGVQQMLADLYARRGFGDGGGKRTRAPNPAVARALEGGPQPIELAEDLPEPEPAAAPEPILLSTPKSAHRPAGHGLAIELPPEPIAQASELPVEEPPATEIEVALEEPVAAAARATPSEALGRAYELEFPDEPEARDNAKAPRKAYEIELSDESEPAADEEAHRKAYEIELPDELSADFTAAKEEPAASSVDAAPSLELSIEVEPPTPAVEIEIGLPAPSAPTASARPASATSASGSIPLEIDDAEVASEILGKLETPRPVVPGPPPPPSRIIASTHRTPPGLRRKTESEPAPLPATAPAPRVPTQELRDSSELRASLAAFSSFDDLEPGGFGGHSPRPAFPARTAPRALAVPELQEPAPASAQAPQPSVPPPPAVSPPPKRRMGPTFGHSGGGFTELELTGDSLLHAVELAAQQATADAFEDEPPQEAPPVDASEAEEPEDSETPSENELPRIPLFSDLPHEAFIALFERAPLRRLGMGDRIITQGTVGDAFYVICEGAVRVVREDDGQVRELARLENGSFFGEMALLSGAPRTASVESADEDTQLLEISAPMLAELSREHPQIATALRKFCRQRMLANVMESSALFRPFSKSDRRSLIEKFRAREVKPRDVVIQEGQRGDGLYVVLAGEVEVVRASQTLAHLKEGDLFGEMSLLEKKPATATVRATKRTSLLRLPREDFDALILTHPQILMLVSELTEDRRKQNQALVRPPAASLPEGDEPLVMV